MFPSVPFCFVWFTVGFVLLSPTYALLLLLLVLSEQKVLKSLEQQSACSPDSNAPHIHFSTDASREPGGGTTSQASSASSASLASIISIDNNRFGKADSYEHQHHHQHQHQQHQQHQQQLHSHPLHSTMMMTPSSMSPSPSGSMSISLGSLPQQYQSSSLSSVSSRPLPTPLCSHPPLSPVTANVPYHYSQQAQKEHEAALQKQAIYFSSTSSEPATYHHIRRAPEAIRHFGGCGERTCLPKAQIYRVIHPYKPQQIDEIELTYGDLLTVTTLCDDGWYLGRSTLSGKFGTFPGNYVEQV